MQRTVAWAGLPRQSAQRGALGPPLGMGGDPRKRLARLERTVRWAFPRVPQLVRQSNLGGFPHEELPNPQGVQKSKQLFRAFVKS